MKMTLLAMMVISSVSFAQVTPELCQIAYNGRVSSQIIAKTQGDGFYNQAHLYALDKRVCVKAQLTNTPQGVRVYRADGSRIGNRNGNQGSELSQQAEALCVVMTCIPVVDSKAQTGAGYGTGGYVQPGSRIGTDHSTGAPVVVPTYPSAGSGSSD